MTIESSEYQEISAIVHELIEVVRRLELKVDLLLSMSQTEEN